jgi:Spy/CpxP family protein refolding chaperone
MRKCIYKTFAITLISAGCIFAQSSASTPPNPPTVAQIVAGQVARLTALLTLTSAQQTSATAIFTTAQTALAAVHASMKAQQTALQTAIVGNDATGIATAANQLGILDTQLVEARATGDAAFYQILTSTQQTQYKTLLSMGLMEGGPGPGGGPGGHGGPGGGPGGPH